MYQRILVALGDETTIDDKVIAEAAAIARATRGTLNLLHVLLPPGAGIPNPMYLTADGMHSTVTADSFQMHLHEWQTLQHNNQKTLDTRTQALSEQGLTAEWTQAVGDPGRQVCKIAQDWQADLVVLGRHARSGVAELFLGSVSNYVVHHAPCSVVAVQGVEAAVTA